jgi:DNA repair protein RadC
MEIEIKDKNKIVTDPAQAALLLEQVLKSEQEIDQKKEHFWSIGLNSRNGIEYLELVSLGTLTANLVNPREVFRLAVMKGVAELIFVHNHPSGEVEPSEDDLIITHRLVRGGELLGIEVYDHIIIGKDKYFSFRAKKLISGKSP